MGRIELTVDIAAPMGDIFFYISDVRTHPRYAPFCKELEITSAKQRGSGTTFTQKIDLGGKLLEIESVITQYVPDEMIEWQNLGHKAKTIVQYWLKTTEDKKTRVTHIIDGPMFDDPKLKEEETRLNRIELDNLKKILEETPLAIQYD